MDRQLSRTAGAGSSGRIIEDQYITAPISAGGDGITVYGSDGPVVIRRCVAIQSKEST